MSGQNIYPISELIMQNVMDVLSQVTLSSGYSYNLFPHRVDQRNEISPDNGVVLVEAGNPIPSDSPPLGFDEFNLPITIVAFVVESETNNVPIDRQLYAIAADIRKALTQDLQRGANAINTRFPVPDELNLDASPKCVLVNPRVQYRTLFNNPYKRF